MACPTCGGKMESGYIAGHWTRLRWTEKAKTKTIFAGQPLKKKVDLWNSPTLEALRCTGCGIGVFCFDR